MTEKDSDTLRTAFDAIWRYIADQKDKIHGKSIEVPEFVPSPARDTDTPTESRYGTDFAVLRHVESAFDLARQFKTAEIAELLASALPLIRWSQNPNYTEAKCSRSLLDGYAYAAMGGPDGPIECAAPRGGIMLMGPHVTYPDHFHSPREVYLVLTPGAQWRLDEGEWFDVEPGDLLFHDAWQMHATRTADQPLLAFAGWIEPGERLSIDWGKGSTAIAN